MTAEIFRYVGGETTVGTKLYNRIGQVIDFNPRGMGVPVITDQQFKDIFTDEAELKRFGLSHAREAAPESFIAKLRQAWALVDHDLIYAEPEPVPAPIDQDPIATEPEVG